MPRFVQRFARNFGQPRLDANGTVFQILAFDAAAMLVNPVEKMQLERRQQDVNRAERTRYPCFDERKQSVNAFTGDG